MNNVRFATSIHILTLLARYKHELLSSEYIASSININPAIVRKELSNLRELGMVESKEGKGGGSMLAKSAKSIRMSDIYTAVRQSSVLGKANNPSEKCPVGRQIQKHMDQLYDAAEQALVNKLEKTTLAEFVKQFD